jgi:hypothetical protein
MEHWKNVCFFVPVLLPMYCTPTFLERLEDVIPVYFSHKKSESGHPVSLLFYGLV